MSYSNRIFFYGPVGLLLMIVVLYGVFWRVQADTLSARLDRANGGEVMPGIVFAFSEKAVGGFPFRIDVVLSGVTFSHQAPEGETAWRTEKLAIHRLSYGQNRYIFETSGLQSFAQPPPKPGTVPRVTYLTPALSQASAILAGDKVARFDLDLAEPQAKDATLGADPTRTASAARAQLHLLARPDNSIDVAIEIDNARIGTGYSTNPAESTLALIRLRAKLMAAKPLDALRAGTMSFSDAVPAWRANMGTIAVSDLALNWSDAHAGLKGDLALDEAANLTGTLSGDGTKDGKASAAFKLSFAKGEMRLVSESASAAEAP